MNCVAPGLRRGIGSEGTLGDMGNWFGKAETEEERRARLDRLYQADREKQVKLNNDPAAWTKAALKGDRATLSKHPGRNSYASIDMRQEYAGMKTKVKWRAKQYPLLRKQYEEGKYGDVGSAQAIKGFFAAIDRAHHGIIGRTTLPIITSLRPGDRSWSYSAALA